MEPYKDLSERSSLSTIRDDEAADGLISSFPKFKRNWSLKTAPKALLSIILLLCITIGLQIAAFYYIARRAPSPMTSPIGIPSDRNTKRIDEWPSRFLSDDVALMDRSWDNLHTGHGIVKLSPAEAEALNLPKGLPHPLDPSKLMYSTEAYHLLHCTKILRIDYFRVRAGKEPWLPEPHVMHCFDVLRKSIVCEASDHLLAVHETPLALGVNQTRQCRDWIAVRDWATEHTACYKDIFPEPAPGESRYGHCDDGTDGVFDMS